MNKWIDPSLPFIDLHRHLDGTARLETILDLGRQHNIDLPGDTVDKLRPYIQIQESQPGVMAFIAKFHWILEILVDYDACRRLAYENISIARDEGLDYLELRFSPAFMARRHNLSYEGVVEAVVDGIRAGVEQYKIPANIIGIISRTYGAEMGTDELNAILSQRDHIVGLDLAGDETNFPGDMFTDHTKTARDNGLRITIHAGEAAGSESVWQAVTELKAERIGHGVAAIQDNRLMEYIQNHQIGIEVNLTSNVQTQTVPSYVEHPAKKFLDAGLLVSLNSDDPTISGIDLHYEFLTAASLAGLTPSDTSKAQFNALITAFLTDEGKQRLADKKLRSFSLEQEPES